MDLSVIIPTRGRPKKLASCLSALSRQSLEPGRYEVLIGIDGPDSNSATTTAARNAWTLDQSLLSITPLEHRGQAAARNSLLPHARGRTLLFLNDDMIPARDLLAAHHAEQERQRHAGTSALVIGAAPWTIHHPDRLFDRLVRETSMVFFYNRRDAAINAEHATPTQSRATTPPLPEGGGLGGWVRAGKEAHADPNTIDCQSLGLPSSSPRPSDQFSVQKPCNLTPVPNPSSPNHNWSFRHAWLLNLSANADQVRASGGFTVFPSTYGYEDDELAFRMAAQFNTRVLYRPAAIAHHDHRLEPAGYLEREYKLGYAAWGFANTTPDCARAMFNRDLRDPAELDYSRQVLTREHPAATRARQTFNTLAELPATAISGEHAPALIELVYQQHLPLKRFVWRMGLVDAGEGREMGFMLPSI